MGLFEWSVIYGLTVQQTPINCGRIAEQRWEDALGGVAAADQAATAILGNESSLGAKALNTLIPPLLALVSTLIHYCAI